MVERTRVVDLVPVVHESKVWEELFHSAHQDTAHSLFHGGTRLDGGNLNVDAGCREVLAALKGWVVLLKHIDLYILFQVYELSHFIHVGFDEVHDLGLCVFVFFNDTLILEVQIHTKLSNRSGTFCVVHRHAVQEVRIVKFVELI